MCPKDRGPRLVLRQPLIGRVATALAMGPGVFGLGLAGLAPLPERLFTPLVVGWMLWCVVLAVRGYRLAVTVTADSVVVHGLVRTRTIPRTAVEAVTPFPALRWRDAAGGHRWTPMTVLMTTTNERRRYRIAKHTQLTQLHQTLGMP